MPGAGAATTRKRKPRVKNNYIRAAQCSAGMSFDECQLEVVRAAVAETTKNAPGLVNAETMNNMTDIVEGFIIKKRLVCYGGTAINNILPRAAQFYDRTKDIPDYDFFSSNAIDDAKELADIYHKQGYSNVEAKAGVHHGTFKVFVNFVPMADVSFIHAELMARLRSEAVVVRGIYYCPPDYLRMNMYLELSRPAGDVSRWEKVALRLMLLDRYHPLKTEGACPVAGEGEHNSERDRVASIVQKTLMDEDAVFFGGFALDMFVKPDPGAVRPAARHGGFDVLHASPEKCAMVVSEQLQASKVTGVTTVAREEVGEIIPECHEVHVDGRAVAFIYKPDACRGYNELPYGDGTIRVATIDTMMTFFLAFFYTNDDAAVRQRVLCMAKQLFDLSVSRIHDSGAMKRFAVKCYGPRIGLNDLRIIKSAKYKDLKARGVAVAEFDDWFLKYTPGEAKKAPARPARPAHYRNTYHRSNRRTRRHRRRRPRRIHE
jgi:hypothetical protein